MHYVTSVILFVASVIIYLIYSLYFCIIEKGNEQSSNNKRNYYIVWNR